jgi:D-alanine-D-alanine ligase-like ATP-grasp enzyme
MNSTQNQTLKIGLLFGGQSGEHEVSLVSAKSIAWGCGKIPK